MLKFSAFLFAALIFFVTFLHQGKKVKMSIVERMAIRKMGLQQLPPAAHLYPDAYAIAIGIGFLNSNLFEASLELELKLISLSVRSGVV